MVTRYLVLAYGEDEATYRQAWMLFVSLRAYSGGSAELVVLTEHPHRFDWAIDSIRVEHLAAQQLAAWRRGSSGWRHKIEASRVWMPHEGALVLLDTDVLAVAPLDEFTDALYAGSIFLHKREGVLSQSRRRGNRRLWESLQGRSFDGWEVRPSDAMWNAGVVALRQEDAALLDDALTLHDAIAAAGFDHLFLEQLATSVVFGRTGRLHPAQPYFAHYWGNKEGFDRAIAERMALARSQGWTVEQTAADYRHRPFDLPLEVRPGPWRKLAHWLGR